MDTRSYTNTPAHVQTHTHTYHTYIFRKPLRKRKKKVQDISCESDEVMYTRPLNTWRYREEDQVSKVSLSYIRLQLKQTTNKQPATTTATKTKLKPSYSNTTTTKNQVVCMPASNHS